MKITRNELKALIREQMELMEADEGSLTDLLNAAFTAAKAGDWHFGNSAEHYWRAATEHPDAGGVGGLFSYGIQEKNVDLFKADLDSLGAGANPKAEVTVDVA